MARIFEYQGKELLRKVGIPVPKGQCIVTADEAKKVAKEIGKPVVAKAQVWVTGRLQTGGRQGNPPASKRIEPGSTDRPNGLTVAPSLEIFRPLY